MKKVFIFLVLFVFSSIVFAQVAAPVISAEDAAKKAEIQTVVDASLAAQKVNSIAFSGNVYTGLQADISKSSSKLYAWEDANDTPIWANFRIDYTLDQNAGATLNFRVKSVDAVSTVSTRSYPFMNRGFVWVKTPNSMFKVRSGYLWDSDFESSFNAWDTASNYEWVTEFTANPIKGIELGVTVPTAYNKADLVASLQDITYGLVYSPSFGRLSVMGQYGSVDANRDINFGADFTAVKNLLIRLEGDLQQIGIDNKGYYELMPEVSYTLGSFVPDLQVYTFIYKDNVTPTMIKAYPNLTWNEGKFTSFAGFYFNFDPANMNNAYKQLEINTQYTVNAKCHIKPGFYITSANPSTDVVFTPYVEFYAAF